MGFFGSKKYIILRNDEYSIEPEEIFFDARVKKNSLIDGNDLAESKMEIPISLSDFWIVGAVILMASIIMFFYDVRIQFFLNSKFSAQAQGNSTRVQSIKAPRGIIYDRNFNALVSNEPSFDVVVVPKDLPMDNLDGHIEKLGVIIGISANELKVKFEDANRMSILPVILKENLDKNSALLLETQLDNFKGVRVEKNAVRDYKDGPFFSSIIGYTAKISSDELMSGQDYTQTDYIGKMGIEQSYENFLRGKNGEYVTHLDAHHNILKEGKEMNPEVGNSVVLSVDVNLQKMAYELVDEARKKFGMGATLVAMNPKNGKILAMVSAPGYDNNLFSHGISSKDYQMLMDDELRPLFNRAIAGKYPPGSNIKPFIASAALQENVISPEREILSTGSIMIGSNPETAFVFHDWKEGGHGFVNVYKAIAESVNTYFYTIGGGYGNIQGLGIDRIKKYLELFGFGAQSEVDIAGSTSGFIPNPNWKKSKLNEIWYIGDTYNASIGQGYILVTPLQLVTAISAIANGGTLYRPELVDKIIDSDKNVVEEISPEVVRSDFIDKKNIDAVRKGMREAVVNGSARSLNQLPLEIAGKTGTAQFGGEKKTHAWFSAFAPYDDPEIAITILVEGGGEGSSVSVPIAREIFQWWYDNMPKK